MEKGPPDVSWVRAAPGVGWAAAAAFPAEARPWVGTEVTRRKRFRKRRGRGQGAALEAPPPLKVAPGGANGSSPPPRRRRAHAQWDAPTPCRSRAGRLLCG